MDIVTIGAAVSIFTAVIISIIVLHPDIKEGIIVKASLIVCIFSLFATAAIVFTNASSDALWKAGTLLRFGLAGVCVGILYRARILGKIRRKIEKEIDGRRRTRTIMNLIAEPVHDIAFLFTTDFSQLEREHKK
jgi:hypothetical protein